MGYKKRTVSKTGEITDEIIESVPEGVPQPEPSQSGSSYRTEPELPTPEPEIDEAAGRKQEIADKRRASLALARTKIVPKSALKKQADDAVKTVADVIKTKDAQLKDKQEETDAMRLKYERDRVKQLEDNLMTLQKLIAEKPAPVVAAPVVVVEEPPKRKQRPSRSKEALASRAERDSASALVVGRVPEGTSTKQPTQIIPKKSVEPRMVAPPSTEKLIDKSYSEQLQERLRSQAVNKIMMETFGGF